MIIERMERGIKLEMVESISTVKTSSSEYVIGKHVYGNLYGIDREIASNKEFLEEIMVEAARQTGAKIVEVKTWDFTGKKKGGVSIIILVEESHLALHTWEEYGYATLDIYTCGDHTDPLKGFYYVVDKIKPRRYNAHYVVRDSRTEELVETVIKG